MRVKPSIVSTPLRGACAAVLLASASLAAAEPMKPGLWQVKQQMALDPAQQAQFEQMRQQLAAMPPAQRKQMEEMMSRQGARIDFSASGMSTQVCLSKEDAVRDSLPIERRPGCEYTPTRSGATMRVSFVCTQPPSKGEIEVTTLSPERYTMKLSGSGGPNNSKIAMQGEGQWLAADCGKVKPYSAVR